MIHNTRYSEARVEIIRQNLERYAANGEPRDYDIFVDDAPVVFRTKSLDAFQSFEQAIEPESRTVTIRIFAGSSNNNDKHILYLQELPEQKAKDGLGGLDEAGLQGLIQKQVDQARSGWEFEAAKKENAKLTRENNRLQSEVDRLSNELSEQRSSSGQMGLLGAAVGPFVDGLLKTSQLNRSPLGKLLAPAEGGGSTNQSQDAEVSFEPVSGTAEVNADVLEFARHLEQTFSQAELDKLFPLIGACEKDRSLIDKLYQAVVKQGQPAIQPQPVTVP